MAVIKFLHSSAQVSDGVCRLVAMAFPDEVLLKLFELDAYLPRPSKEYLNSFYLHLMSDAPFKRRLARVYAKAFPTITTSFQRGYGLIDSSIYSLSVQFLNRAMFVIALREERDFYRVLMSGLYRSLVFATNGGYKAVFMGDRGSSQLLLHSRTRHNGADASKSRSQTRESQEIPLWERIMEPGRVHRSGMRMFYGTPLRVLEFLDEDRSALDVERPHEYDYVEEFLRVFNDDAGAESTVEEGIVFEALDGLCGGSFQLEGEVEKWIDGLFDGKESGRFYLADRMASPHPGHWVLRFRRYIPIMSDLKCILTVPGVASCFWADAGPLWLRLLSLAQGLHPQQRQKGAHVEFEEDHWMFAFNLFISLNASFEGLLSWLGDFNPRLVPEPEGRVSASAKSESSTALNGGGIDANLLCRLARNQEDDGSLTGGSTKTFLRYINAMEANMYGSSCEPAQCLCSIGAALARDALALAQTRQRSFVAVPALTHMLHESQSEKRWLCLSGPLPSQSFHIPLHRFWAAALRHAARVTQVHALQAARLLPRLGEGFSGCWEILIAHYDVPPLLLGLCSVCVSRRGLHMADVDIGLSIKEKIQSLKVLNRFHDAGVERQDSPLKTFWDKYGTFADSLGEPVELPNRLDRDVFLGDLDRAYAHVYTMPLVGDIIDEVLGVVVMASQISSGMWRRNGMSIQDQVNNYGEGLFFKIFRDLDVIALQFAALLYGPDAFVSHVVHRFGLFGVLSEDCYGAQPHDLNEEDTEYAIPLLENMLQFLIILATEFPQPPEGGENAENDREMMQLEREPAESMQMTLARREMVHKLAAKSRTHSELSDCSTVFRSEPLSQDQVTRVIKDIAVEKGADDLLAALKYELKPELWAEYDPCYYHLTRIDHEAAMSRKPQPKAATPICPVPPLCHPLFSKFRCDLLSSDSVFLILYEILQRTRPKIRPKVKRPLDNEEEAEGMEVETRVPPSPPQQQVRSAQLYSDLVELRCVQLLTLALHVEGREYREVYGTSDDDCGNVGFYARIAAFRGGELIEILARMETMTQDASIKYAVGWVLKMLKRDESCAAIITRIKGQISGAAKSKVKARSRAKLAQQRAAERMKQRAKEFARSYTAVGEDSANDIEVDSDFDEDRARGDSGNYSEGPECIICRAATEEPLHFVGFCERSRVLSLHPHTQFGRGARGMECFPCNRAGASASSSPEESSIEHSDGEYKVEESNARTGTHKEPVERQLDLFAREVGAGSGLFVQGCGHPLHLTCFSKYFRSNSGRPVHHLLEDKGEFSCPLCSQLGNILVPHFRPKPVPERKMNADSPRTSEESLSPESIRLWLEQGLPEIARGYRSLADNGNGQSATTGDSIASGGITPLPLIPAVSYPFGEEEFSPAANAAHENDNRDVQIIPGSVGLTSRFLNSLWSVWQGRKPVDEVYPGTVRGPRVGPNSALGVCKLLGYTVSALEAELGIRALCSSGECNDDGSRIGVRNPGLGLTKRIDNTRTTLRELRAGMQNLPFDFRARLVEVLQLQVCPSLRQEKDEKDIACQDGWMDAECPYTVLLESPLGVLLAFLCIGPPDAETPLTIGNGSDVSIASSFVRFAVSSSWLIALWQICFSELHGHVHGLDSEFSAPGKCLKLLDPENADGPSSLLAFLRQVARSCYSRSGDLMQCTAESLVKFEQRVQNAFGAHMRCAAIMLTWLAPEQYHEIICLCLSSTPGEELALKRLFGVPNIEAFLESPDFMEWNSTWARVRNSPIDLFMGRSLCGDQSSRCSALQMIVAMGFLHGLPKPALIELPGDYTELHAKFTLRQALCLVCGEILVVDGKGSASEHAETCGCGQGIFYLIREGHVLLLHGSKGAYFPSPYVDNYGERHRKFRTIPLKLEPRRWEAVQRLWAQHGIAIEVAHQRATARQVIVDNWY